MEGPASSPKVVKTGREMQGRQDAAKFSSYTSRNAARRKRRRGRRNVMSWNDAQGPSSGRVIQLRSEKEEKKGQRKNRQQNVPLLPKLDSSAGSRGVTRPGIMDIQASEQPAGGKRTGDKPEPSDLAPHLSAEPKKPSALPLRRRRVR